MKKIILALALIIVGCSNHGDTITLKTGDYKKLIGDTLVPDFPTKIENSSWSCDVKLVQMKNHEYLFVDTGSAYGGISLCHYPDCKFCKKDSL